MSHELAREDLWEQVQNTMLAHSRHTATLLLTPADQKDSPSIKQATHFLVTQDSS